MGKQYITISKEAKKLIYNIMIDDYTRQLGDHKRNKHNFDYKQYRKIYVRLHNNIQNIKKSLKDLGE